MKLLLLISILALNGLAFAFNNQQRSNQAINTLRVLYEQERANRIHSDKVRSGYYSRPVQNNNYYNNQYQGYQQQQQQRRPTHYDNNSFYASPYGN